MSVFHGYNEFDAMFFYGVDHRMKAEGFCIPCMYIGVARGGGSWGARDPPFVSLLVSKQLTIFR